MSSHSDVAAALAKGADDSKKALAGNRQAATGNCTISSSGYSECKSKFTRDACDSRKGPGFTVTWVEGGSC